MPFVYRTRIVVLLGAAVVLAYWKPLFHSEFTLLAGGDMCTQTYPWFTLAASSLKRGVLPLWDPYVYAGKSMLGELQPAILYPLNWVFWLFPVAGGGVSLAAIQYLIALHFLLAAFFCYLLARSLGLSFAGALLAGIAFALGGYQFYGHVNIFGSIIWLPFVAFCFRRVVLCDAAVGRGRWVIAGALGITLSFLAGHHGGAFHTGLFLLLYASFELGRRRWRGWIRIAGSLAGIGVVSMLLAAVQWLPSLEWARQSLRWVGRRDPVGWGEKIPYAVLQGTPGLMPQDVISLLLPHAGTQADLYFGAPVLFLALLAVLFLRRAEVLFFGCAALFYLLLGFGAFSALHGWVNTFIPGLWFAREVFLYLVPFELCLALLAGWGLDFLAASCATAPDRAVAAFLRRSGWAMALLVLNAGILIMAGHMFLHVGMDDARMQGAGILAVDVALLGALLYLLRAGRLNVARFCWLMIALVTFDLSSHISERVLASDRPRGAAEPSVKAFWKMPDEAKFLIERRRFETFRVDDPDSIFPPNFGDSWRLESTQGHGATALVTYMNLRNTGWNPASNASALLNARYIVSSHPLPWLTQAFGAENHVYRNPRAVPRAFAALRYRAVSNEREALQWIPTPVFVPRETVLIKECDVLSLAPEFVREACVDQQDLDIRVNAYQRAAEGLADTVAEGRPPSFYDAPWGWAEGDRLDVDVRSKGPSARLRLVVNFLPVAPAVSRLAVKKVTGTGEVTVSLELPGLRPGVPGSEEIRSASADLGPIDRTRCRLLFTRTAECSARIDSVRFATTAADEPSGGEVSVTTLEPNRLVLDARMKRAGLVGISNVYYRGWEASLDGRPAPLLMADYLFQAVPVPSGSHVVELVFRPKAFRQGLLLTVLTSVAISIFLLVTRNR
jgi:hypothetical protein